MRGQETATNPSLPPSETAIAARTDWLTRDFPIPASIDVANFKLADLTDRNISSIGSDVVQFIEFMPEAADSALIGITGMGVVFQTDLSGNDDKEVSILEFPSRHIAADWPTLAASGRASFV